MTTRWQLTVKKFSRNDEGAVALLFGIMTFVLFFMGAIAVDYSRVVDMRTRISSAVDAASLAAGRALLDGDLSDSEIITLANTYFDHDVAPAKVMGTIATPDIKIDREAGTVDINVKASAKMTLARVGGIDSIDLPVSSAAIYKQKDIEVGMALDITGSMNETVGGKRKIDALKDAFQQFADRLIPDQNASPQKVRIALAPYSSSVNLGTYAGAVTRNRSTDGCATERKNNVLSDVSPADGAFYVKADGKDDIDNSDAFTPTNAYSCPSARITPLTDDKAQLISAVDSYQANGWTAGHLGVQWAWNMISDKWAGTFNGDAAPDAHDKVENDKLIKAVVIMTDGSFNTAYHGTVSGNRNWSKNQATGLCNAIKAAGSDVVVFAVAFAAPADAQQTLKACASAGEGYYVNASSPEDLEAAFQKFAGKLSQLRITK